VVWDEAIVEEEVRGGKLIEEENDDGEEEF
jgi:hypothetical protein